VKKTEDYLAERWREEEFPSISAGNKNEKYVGGPSVQSYAVARDFERRGLILERVTFKDKK